MLILFLIFGLDIFQNLIPMLPPWNNNNLWNIHPNPNPNRFNWNQGGNWPWNNNNDNIQ